MGDTACSSQAAKGTAAKNTLSPRARPVDTGKQIIFTGPNGTGDYRTNLGDYTFYIGSRTSPKEGTSEALYLWRPAPMNRPPWRRKDAVVGEIGWGVEEYGPLLQSGFPRRKQMKKEVFPPAEEHELIYRYMNPRWKIHPAPDPQVLGRAGYYGNDPARLAIDSMDSLSHRVKN
ncbi:protein SPMIP2 isoform X2 [Tiliqua scincoides]